MIPAPVGHQCPACVDEARKAFKEGPAQRVQRIARGSVTRILLGSILAMFLLEIGLTLLAPGPGGSRRFFLQPSLSTLVDLGASVPPLIASGQYWRLLTAMFLHASLLHILLNAWALWIFGQFVEDSFGRLRLLGIYFVSGFLASVTSYAFGNPGAVGVGASGAITGLLGAFIAYNLRRRHLSLAQNNLRLAVMIIIMNAVFGLAVANVDNWAHGGGLVAGLLAGWVMEGFGPRRTRVAVTVIGLLTLLGIGVGIAMWRTAALQAQFVLF